MTKHLNLIDIETDGLDPTVVWCIVVRQPSGKGDPLIFTHEGRLGYAPTSSFKDWAKGQSFIGHNIAAFDIPVLNRLLDADIDNTFPNVIDTFVVSRLVQFSRFTTHSLDELGTALGYPKTEFNDWSNLTQEMVDYCVDDTEVNAAIWRTLERFTREESWQKSMWCEHEMHKISADMRSNGFHFNRELAEMRLAQVDLHIALLEEELAKFEPFEREDNPIKFQVNKDGSLGHHVQQSYEKYHRTELKGDMLHRYKLVPFNPGSTKDRVEKLWEFGWEPTEKTDTAYKFEKKGKPGHPWGDSGKILTLEEYNAKKEYFDYYGWTVNEANLETLPADAPEGARTLAQWLTLDGRRKALRERLENCEDDSRIRTNFWHIGSWTHRMSHSAPNLANISSPFYPPKDRKMSPVEEIKSEYDADMRVMFDVEEGYLVGTDAESIQLRILAHYLKNDEYVNAILKGSKADETDIHNVNRRALGLNHLTRDHAKTFIYAWLLGAGVGKVSRILETSMVGAKTAVDTFIERTDGLSALKSGLIERDARRGYFDGLDGRKVICNSAYLMLAGYLQNGETVVMKHANIRWRNQVDLEGIRYKQVNFVHDEWQTQVYGTLEEAERVGQLQCEALEWAGEELGCYCPMAGETRVGTNWLETH